LGIYKNIKSAIKISFSDILYPPVLSFKHMPQIPPGIYTNNQAASDFQEYLRRVMCVMAIYMIKNLPYIGIIVNESLDIAPTKNF
jgi:hypothetical protein